MQKILALVSLIYSMAISASPDITIPIHPDEAKLVKAIIAIEGHAVEVAEVPGWAKSGVINRLKELGIDTSNLKSWGVRGTESKGLSFSCVYDSNGRVLALTGNGPWLRNDSLRALKALPNLAVVEIWNSCDWSDADLEALKAAKPKVRFHMVGGPKK